MIIAEDIETLTNARHKSTKYLRVCLFCLWTAAYLLLNGAPYDDEILHADAYRPCAGHVLGFMSIGVVVAKIMTFSKTAGWLAAKPVLLTILLAQTGRWLVGLSGKWLVVHNKKYKPKRLKYTIIGPTVATEQSIVL